ncbi:apolipoprotein N-acyltransferase [Micrococcales bacterium 31B]|nr:apolipoprotein N-acyltransferase [Micrococcales bacterium 31B]
MIQVSETTSKRRRRRPRTYATSPWSWRPLPWWLALLVCAGSGYALHFAFPGYNFWWVAPLALGGFYVGTRVRRARFGYLVGLAFGLGHMLPVISWTNIFVGNVPWIALATLEALFAGFVGLGMAVVHKAFRAPWLRALIFAGLFIGAEYGRSVAPFGGFPWGRVAFSQSDSPLKALASIGGPPLLGFAVCLLGVALVYLVRGVVRRRGEQWVPAFPVWPLAAGALLLIVGFVIPLPTAPEQGSIKVAAIQGSQRMMTSLEEGATPAEVLANHVRVTEELLATGFAPDLVIWPESSTDVNPDADPEVMRQVQQVVADAGAPVLIGTQQYTPEKFRYNLAQLWVPNATGGAEETASYAKMRPAPFAEYIPYPEFFRLFSSAVDLVTYQMLPGDTVGALPVAASQNRSGQAFTVGVGICFEVAFDDVMRNTVRDGATIVAVPTNNATFGYTDESVQQLAMSQIQAVTLGRTVVQASTVGVSGIVLPDGTLLDRSGHWTAESLTGIVPLRTSQTLATQIGEGSPISLTAIGLAGFIGAAIRLSIRRQNQRQAGQ